MIDSTRSQVAAGVTPAPHVPHVSQAAPHVRDARVAQSIDWMPFALGLSLAWLLYLVAIPIGYMVVDSFTDDGLTLSNFVEFASDRKFVGATVNSLVVAAGVALLSVLIGAPLAF